MTLILAPSTPSVGPAPEVDPRIDAVRRYRVLETPSDGDAAKIVRLAADLFGVPIAVVSLVDEDRIWLRSCFGLEGIESLPLDPGLCVTAILSSDVYVVPSARDDPRALANPLVAGDMGLQFYAAAPLMTYDGHRLGNLAILDLQPRDLSEHDRSVLRQLASLYMDELEMRLEARRIVAREREQRAEAERQRSAASNLARTLQTSLLPPRLPHVTGLDLAVEFEPAAADVVGGDFYDVFQHATGAWFLVLGDACGKGPRAAAYTASVRHAVRAHTVHELEPAAVLRAVNETLLVDVDLTGQTWATLVLAVLQPTASGWQADLALAGHPRPFLLCAGGDVQRVGGHGSIVGAIHSAEFTSVSVSLEPGDALVLYSDGVPDAVLPSGETFGEERLAETLADFCGGDADKLATAVLQELTERGAQQRDDVCLLVAQVP